MFFFLITHEKGHDSKVQLINFLPYNSTVCLFVFFFRTRVTISQGNQIGPHRTNMTDLTYGTCFTHECKAFGAFRRSEGKTIPISGVNSTVKYMKNKQIRKKRV